MCVCVCLSLHFGKVGFGTENLIATESGIYQLQAIIFLVDRKTGLP
jgi:hypothetical protein